MDPHAIDFDLADQERMEIGNPRLKKLYNYFSEVSKNAYRDHFLLSNAILIYIIIAITMTIANFFIKGVGFISSFEIIMGVFLMIIFGIGEFFMGLGILKLKENLGSLAQITGIAKIINGALLISVILSPIALFFVVPILILEVVFLHTTFKNAQNSLEIRTEEAYSL